MKSLNYTIQKILTGYENWLDEIYYYQQGDLTIKFVSGNSYSSFLTKAIADLRMNPHVFKHYSRPDLVSSLESKIVNSTTFEKRSLKMQTNIISAFRAYIKYVQTK
jgi:hypothetical protein